MIETTIGFILSLIKQFVKFLGQIEITLYGYTFSFYSFALASIIILVLVSGVINVVRKAGSSFVSIGGSVIDAQRDADLKARNKAEAEERLMERRQYNAKLYNERKRQLDIERESRFRRNFRGK